MFKTSTKVNKIWLKRLDSSHLKIGGLNWTKVLTKD